MKKTITIVKIIATNMVIVGFISQRFSSATEIIAVYEVISVCPNTRLLSIIPRSFENLLMRIPEGVASKKWLGLRMVDSIMSSWMLLLEIRIELFSMKYFITKLRKYKKTNRLRALQKRLKSPPKWIELPATIWSNSARNR